MSGLLRYYYYILLYCPAPPLLLCLSCLFAVVGGMLCKSDKPFIIIITGKTNNYCQKLGGETIIRLLKKVVWTFPERNGKIIGWLVGIPAVTVNLCRAD